MYQTGLYSLLNDIIEDHPTFAFPVSHIQPELLSLYLKQTQFDEICANILIKLNRKYRSKVISHTFFLLLDKFFPAQLSVIDELEPSVYQDKIEEFIEFLSRIRITRISLDSPDGLLMKEMN
jgi:hypothetical protein